MRRILSACFLFTLCSILCVPQTGSAQTLPYGTATLEAAAMKLTISRGGMIAPLRADGTPGLTWPGAPVSTSRTDRVLRTLLNRATPVLAGKVRGEVRVSGNHTRDNYLPGPILPGLRTVNPYDPRYRAFTIRIGDNTAPDYLDWPYDLGAPVDSSFSPEFYGSPQMFWVMNDLDSAAMRADMGSDPMGLELRCLAWPTSELSGLGDDALLLQFTWINQGADSIRDAYAGFFADPDVRDAWEDGVGTDSSRALAYVYDDNTIADDEGMPTAFGISMLQTPAVAGLSTDSARWRRSMKTGYRNIPVTAATVPVKNAPAHPAREAAMGEGGAAWYAMLKGEARGTAVRNPLTGAPTGFWFSGDPVTGEGWQMDDGFLFSDDSRIPHDRRDQRVMISAGPFDLAPGDTQQVVIALIAARGATAEAAVYMLRDRADFLRQYYQRRNVVSTFSSVATRYDPQAGGGVDIRFTARSSIVAERVEAQVSRADGSTIVNLPLTALQQGGNTLYTGSLNLPTEAVGVNTGYIVYDGSETHRLPGRVSIPTAGAILGQGAAVLQEGDGNGRIAPDEDAYWIPRMHNSTANTVDLRITHPSLDYTQLMHVTDLPAFTTTPSEAHPWQPAFGARTVPRNTEGWGTDFDSTFFEYDAYDNAANSWWQLRNWVLVDSSAGEWYDLLMTRVQSGSEQLPGVVIQDLDLLEDRRYLARISEGNGTRLLSLYDSATGGQLFADYALDRFNGMAPVTDGFRVVRGTIGSRFTGYFFVNEEGLRPADFGMSLLRAGHSNFAEDERREFRLEFTLDGLQYWNYAERGYEGKVRLPLRAYMRGDAGEWIPAQVALHETGSDIPDGVPNPDGGDYLMLYQLPYDEDAAPEVGFLPTNPMDFPAPLLLNLTKMPTAGALEIEYPVPVVPGDVFAFNPRHFLMAKSNKAPAAATLHPPAPMPFSAWTSALLELQQPGALRVEVLNSLGQRVRVLFDGMRDAGKYLMVWDGYWGDGRPAETGMYLLRAVTGGREITRKLLLMR